ncbi:MAG: DUF2079 domain-containing protein [Deltaproteobacteria bacterium]|nr:DUF2079 domain-containing protein [Deltaproteobacteria bacterium]
MLKNYFKKISNIQISDELVARFRPFLWTVLIGALPGLIIWQLTHLSQQQLLFENNFEFQSEVAFYASISSLFFFALCFAAYRRYAKRGETTFTAFCKKINRFGIGLLIFPFVFYAGVHPLAKEAPFFTMLLCAGAGIIATFVAYEIPFLAAALAPGEKKKRLFPVLVVAAATISWVVFLSHLGLQHHEHLGTRGWDFGLYINSVWHSLHGNPLGCSLVPEGTHAARHFDPILILISPLLLLWPGAEAEVLLTFQCAWIASGVIPLFLLATHQGRNPWLGAALAIIYLLHPIFHGPAIYELHSLILAGPFILWSIYFLETGAMRRFFVSLCLLMLCREDMVAIALCIGMYAFFTGKPKRVALTAIATAVLYGAVIYVTAVSKAVSYDNTFKAFFIGDHSVPTSIILSAVTNPMYMFRYMLQEDKVVYLLQLIVPLLGLPFLRGRYFILYVFGLSMILLSSRSRQYSISMQYSTWLAPLLFVAVPAVLASISNGKIASALKLNAEKLRSALVMGMLFSAFAMSAAYGIFWPNPSFKVGYENLIRDPDKNQRATAQTVQKIKKMIPPDASVLASEHLVPHFAARHRIWSTKLKGYRFKKPEYGILLDLDVRRRRGNAKKIKEQKEFLELLRESNKYERILRENNVSLYKLKSKG